MYVQSNKINNFDYSLKKVPNLEYDQIIKKAHEIVEESNWFKFINSDSKILIKPNFTLNFHKPGVTTSPIILKALVETLHDKCEEITILEGNGGSYLYSADEAAKNHGVPELQKEFGVKWVNISKLETKKISKKINGKKISIKLPDKVEKLGDLLISVPVFKNHCMTTISLGVKNLWGLVPSEMRMLLHSKINLYLPLIGDYYNHKLTFIDGLVGLEGNGPMYGNPIEMKTLLGASNPIIADIIGTKIMKINPTSIGHLVEYAKFKNVNINEILLLIQEKIENYSHELKVTRIPSNYLDLITFKSKSISKLVFDSPLTPFIYYLFNFINGDRISTPPYKLKQNLENRTN